MFHILNIIDMNINILTARIKCLLSIPFYLIFLAHNKNGFLEEELRRWEELLPVVKYKSTFIAFIRMFALFPEYRNVLFFRCGSVGKLMQSFTPCARDVNFIVESRNVNKGLVLQHGYSCMLWPEKIGDNCQIWHHVTIERASGKGNRPKIGDNVKICTGAIVLGDITVGDNVTIAAGAVVVKSVPDNCVVAGNPARIKKKNGVKVDIPL